MKTGVKVCHQPACFDAVHRWRVIHAMFGLPAGATVFSPPYPLLWLMNTGRSLPDLSAMPEA